MKTLKYLPPLIIGLSLTIAGAVLNIPATFVWGGAIACVLIVVIAVKDIMK